MAVVVVVVAVVVGVSVFVAVAVSLLVLDVLTTTSAVVVRTRRVLLSTGSAVIDDVVSVTTNLVNVLRDSAFNTASTRF